MNDTRNRSFVAGVALLTLLASERAMAAGSEHTNHGQMGHQAMPINHESMGHDQPSPANLARPCLSSPTPTAAPPSRHCQGTRRMTGR